MKHESIKTSKRKHVKVVRWTSRKTTRGIKDIPVEVTTSTSQPNPRNVNGRMKGNEATLHERTPSHMDVDETIWVEEAGGPVISKKKRVSSPTSQAAPNGI